MLWDAQTGKLLRTLEAHSGKVISLAMSPDGKRMTSGDDRGRLILWDMEKFEIENVYNTQPGPVLSLAFLGDSRRFLSGCRSDLRLWEPDKTESILALTVNQDISSLAATSQGEILVGTSRGAVLVYDSKTGDKLTQHLRPKVARAAGGEMDNVIFSLNPGADGHVLISDRTGTWDWNRAADSIQLIAKGLTRAHAISPKRDFYFGVSFRDPYFWMRDLAPSGTLNIVTLDWVPSTLALSANGEYLAVAGGGKYDASGIWSPEGPQQILVYKREALELTWESRKATVSGTAAGSRTDYSQVLPGDPPVAPWE
jgi:WD40 repeat protein